ncbi:MAG: choice-of-anchor J domain-containing protein, partial [Bacteroidota bacterium]|nr:choice-of-anchor J domain-containing protein [Bacteroidota bacterium]
GENVPPSITNIAISPQNPTSAESVTVSATITDADGAITSTLLNWGLNAGSLSNTINMSNSTGDNYVADAPIPAQADGTTVYYTIEAEDDSAAINTSSIQSYTVNDEGAVGLPFAEDFETVTEDQPVDINGWTQYIEAGTETWEGREYVGNLYAQFSAYNTGEYINIGWLITPALDLTGYSEVIFSFKSKDGYNNGDPLDVFISSDYSGSGDPNGSSWIELNPVLSTGNTEGYATNWTASGDLSLNNYTGNTVYIAFKYTGGDPSLTTTMQIDDVLVEENYIANEKPVISNIQHTPETPASEDGVTVSATITDPDGTITNAELNWGLSTGNLSNTISMSDAGGDVYSSDTEIPPQTEGTTIYYAIKATDNSEGITISEENSYQVTDMDNQAPVISNVFIEPENPTDEDDVIISASVDDEDGNIESVILKWKKNEEVYVEQDMSFTEGKYSGQILKQPAGAMIHFIILAKDDLGAETNYEDSYEVSEANTIERVNINQAKIFPNPSTGIINIVIPGYTGMLDLKLYDAIGALVFAEAKASFNQKDVTYLHGIEKGVYFLKMSTQSGVTVTRRLIVNY